MHRRWNDDFRSRCLSVPRLSVSSLSPSVLTFHVISLYFISNSSVLLLPSSWTLKAIACLIVCPSQELTIAIACLRSRRLMPYSRCCETATTAQLFSETSPAVSAERPCRRSPTLNLRNRIHVSDLFHLKISHPSNGNLIYSTLPLGQQYAAAYACESLIVHPSLLMAPIERSAI